MSKYEEYRKISENMETYYAAEIKKEEIDFNPVSVILKITVPDIMEEIEIRITGISGEAFCQALKEINE
jgi:hypothetical protein